MLKKWYQLMMDNKDELAKMLTAENVITEVDLTSFSNFYSLSF